MFLINFFSGSEFLGKQIFIVDPPAFWVAFGCWMALLFSLLWLANIQQPTPVRGGSGMGVMAGSFEWNDVKWNGGQRGGRQGRHGR